ncbi:hypothetical protein P8452_37646 [Trifolium repens]|nr:hypothetical protein P8452_37646 [Trifolium repens]
MASYYEYQDETPYGGFTNVYLDNKEFAEVDPMFSAEFWDELQSDWIVMDYHTTALTVKYKKDRVFPLITDGWNEMAIQEIDDFFRVPIYHSRATIPAYTAHFRLQLTNDIINKPYLSIFDEFEDYVRKKNIKWDNFCGDNGQKWEFLIPSTDLPFKSTSIGSRWSEFPAKFGFEAGDIITFKFGSPSPFHVVHIYKV